ncbi:MAG TPA: ATP synthase F0 subunit B [Acidobacteriaceae bacterium]
MTRSLRPRRSVAARWSAAALWCCLLVPVTLAAQPPADPSAQQQQPITTGSPSEKMDAGASNATEEAYRHSSAVQFLARHLHMSTERTAVLVEDVNSGLLILTILYFLAKYLPGAMRGRRETIDRALVDARSATELANQRLQAVEARLAMLDTEIEGLRQQALHAGEEDQQRIKASLERERTRIIQSAEQEISTAQAAAQRELKRFAADLAVDRAVSRIELSEAADQALIAEFTDSLGGVLQAVDFKKRRQN